jgi:hypothetical protein
MHGMGTLTPSLLLQGSKEATQSTDYKACKLFTSDISSDPSSNPLRCILFLSIPVLQMRKLRLEKKRLAEVTPFIP